MVENQGRSRRIGEFSEILLAEHNQNSYVLFMICAHACNMPTCGA